MIVVVIHAEQVRCPATTVRPTGAGTQPLQTVPASQRRKRIDERGGTACPVHAEVDVILRTPPPAPSAQTTRAADVHEARAAARAKVVNQPDVDRIAATVARSDVMKILRGGVQIG